jgi:nicotinamidase/pyrazinamidase
MSDTLFWDVDTQHDFMKADGRLYVPDAEAIIPNLKRLTDHAHACGIRVLASADDHVAGHRELSDQPDFRETFPPHCMRGTTGQAKIPETRLRDPLVIEPDDRPEEVDTRVAAHDGDLLFHKHWFDVFTNPHVNRVVQHLAPDRIVVYGVALDVCNRYAIEGLLERGWGGKLALVTDATKPIHADRAEDLLEEWRRSGVELITTDQAIAL